MADARLFLCYLSSLFLALRSGGKPGQAHALGCLETGFELLGYLQFIIYIYTYDYICICMNII